jgi:hypothetical protein
MLVVFVFSAAGKSQKKDRWDVACTQCHAGIEEGKEEHEQKKNLPNCIKTNQKSRANERPHIEPGLGAV